MKEFHLKNLRKALFYLYYSFQERTAILQVAKYLYESDFRTTLVNMYDFGVKETIPRKAFKFVQSAYTVFTIACEDKNNDIILKDFISAGAEIIYNKYLKNDNEATDNISETFGISAAS